MRYQQYFLFILILLTLASCKSKRGVTRSAAHESSVKRSYYAEKFGLILTREANLKLYAAVDKWYGTPHRLGACEQTGIDCSCLVNRIYNEVYACNTPRDTKGLMQAMTIIEKQDLREGDLVFFTMNKGEKIDHVGIYLNEGKFVHTSSKKGVMISGIEEPHFAKAFKTGGRLKCSSS